MGIFTQRQAEKPRTNKQKKQKQGLERFKGPPRKEYPEPVAPSDPPQPRVFVLGFRV